MGRRAFCPDLVDRAAELKALVAAWGDAVAGRPRVALIRGEAGIGKSGLLAAFESDSASSSALVLHGSCMSVASPGESFTPFRTVLSQLVETVGHDRVRALAGGGVPAVATLLPDLGLAQPSTGGADVPDAVIRLLDKVSRELPLLVAIEDLHWADPATLGLVDYLSRTLRTARLMFAGTIRTSIPSASPVDDMVFELIRLPNVEVIELARLSPSGTRRMLRLLVGKAPDADLAGRVVARSQGIPFFVEELAAAEAAGDHAVPARLQELLLRRTTSLSETAMSVVTAAAVAGRPVDESTLMEVCHLDERTFRAASLEVARAGMWAARDYPGGALDFRHALLREALESSLLPGRPPVCTGATRSCSTPQR